MAPLLVSTGLLALDLPTQNCHVALLTVWAPETTRTRQNTHPAGSAAVGTALRWSSASWVVTASGVVHDRSLQRSTTGMPSAVPGTQRNVGFCWVTVDIDSGAISRGAPDAIMPSSPTPASFMSAPGVLEQPTGIASSVINNVIRRTTRTSRRWRGLHPRSWVAGAIRAVASSRID